MFPLFEPLEQAGFRWLSGETAFLLAVASVRRLKELRALSDCQGLLALESC